MGNTVEAYALCAAAAALPQRHQNNYGKREEKGLNSIASHLAVDLDLDAGVGNHPSPRTRAEQLPACLDFCDQAHLVDGGDAVASIQHEAREQWESQQSADGILTDGRCTTQGQLECLPPCHNRKVLSVEYKLERESTRACLCMIWHICIKMSRSGLVQRLF